MFEHCCYWLLTSQMNFKVVEIFRICHKHLSAAESGLTRWSCWTMKIGRNESSKKQFPLKWWKRLRPLSHDWQLVDSYPTGCGKHSLLTRCFPLWFPWIFITAWCAKWVSSMKWSTVCPLIIECLLCWRVPGVGFHSTAPPTPERFYQESLFWSCMHCYREKDRFGNGWESRSACRQSLNILKRLHGFGVSRMKTRWAWAVNVWFLMKIRRMVWFRQLRFNQEPSCCSVFYVQLQGGPTT